MNIKRTTKPDEQKKLFDEKNDVTKTFDQNIKDLEISIDKSLKIVKDVKRSRKKNE